MARLADRLTGHGSLARTPGGWSLPRPAGAVRDEVRARDDARSRRGDGSPRARVPVAARRRHQRQGLGRRLLRRGAAHVGPSHRALHVAAPRPRERADHGRRPRHHRPRLRDRGARRAGRGGAARPPRRSPGAPDLLRGVDRRGLRPLPPSARGRGRPRGRSRGPARRHERGGPRRLRDRQRRLRPRGVPGPDARRDRRREGGSDAGGAGDGRRPAVRRGAPGGPRAGARDRGVRRLRPARGACRPLPGAASGVEPRRRDRADRPAHADRRLPGPATAARRAPARQPARRDPPAGGGATGGPPGRPAGGARGRGPHALAGPARARPRRSPAPPRRRPQPRRRARSRRVPRRRPALRPRLRGDGRQGRARPRARALPAGAGDRPHAAARLAGGVARRACSGAPAASPLAPGSSRASRVPWLSPVASPAATGRAPSSSWRGASTWSGR